MRSRQIISPEYFQASRWENILKISRNGFREERRPSHRDYRTDSGRMECYRKYQSPMVRTDAKNNKSPFILRRALTASYIKSSRGSSEDFGERSVKRQLQDISSKFREKKKKLLK